MMSENELCSPSIFDKGNNIIVSFGTVKKTYPKEFLTKCFLTMDNQAFFDYFGFNWIPSYALMEQVRKAIRK